MSSWTLDYARRPRQLSVCPTPQLHHPVLHIMTGRRVACLVLALVLTGVTHCTCRPTRPAMILARVPTTASACHHTVRPPLRRPIRRRVQRFQHPFLHPTGMELRYFWLEARPDGIFGVIFCTVLKIFVYFLPNANTCFLQSLVNTLRCISQRFTDTSAILDVEFCLQCVKA